MKRYDGTTGAFLGNFVSPSSDGLSPGSSGLHRRFDLLFGPDGNLYVSDLQVGAAKRYNSLTGAFLGDFVPPGSSGLSLPAGLTLTPSVPVVEVSIDIRPGSMRNPINLSSSGFIPVAIITTDTFEATTVSPSTACFGDDDNPSERDCSEAHGMGHIQDVNGDARPDLLLHFNIRQTGIDPGDARACLTGTTFDDIDVQGCDVISTLTRARGPHLEWARSTTGASR